MSNATVGIGINGTAQMMDQYIGQAVVGSGLFIGLIFVAFLGAIIFKGKGGFPLFAVVMTAGVFLLVNYGYLPELFGPVVWILVAVIWALALLSLVRG